MAIEKHFYVVKGRLACCYRKVGDTSGQVIGYTHAVYTSTEAEDEENAALDVLCYFGKSTLEFLEWAYGPLENFQYTWESVPEVQDNGPILIDDAVALKVVERMDAQWQ